LVYNDKFEEDLDLREVLDSLPHNAAALDEEGLIICVNERWEDFARQNGLAPGECGPGINYLQVLEKAAKNNFADTVGVEKAINGIRAVISEAEEEYSQEYPCHSQEEKRWFKMKVTPFRQGALVLHENIRELENFFELTPDLLCIADTDGNFIKVNQAWSETLGYSAEELEDMSFIDLVHTEDKAETREAMERLAYGNKVQGFVNRFRCRDGSYRYIRWNSAASEGIIYAASHDITKRRRIEEKLYRSREDLQITLNSIGDAVIATDTEGKITRMNPMAEGLTGWPCDVAEGKPLKEVFEIEDARTGTPVTTPVEEVLASGKKVGLANHTQLISRNGEKYQISDSASPIRDEAGEIRGVVLTFRDVSEEYHMRRELERSEKRFQRMLSVIPDMVSIHDTDMNIVYSNWKGFARVPEDKKELDTKCYSTYRDREDICPDCKAKEVLETGEPLQKEVQLPEGGWYDLRVLPIRDNEGELEYFVEWVRDITDEKNRQEKIEYMSYHDELTDLYNRNYLEERMKELNTISELTLSIMMVDVNGLKLINDTYGHKVGDELLIETADILRDSTREKDIIARWSGDEFVILLPETDIDEARKIRNSIEARCSDVDGIPLTLGIGETAKTEFEEDVFEILHEAEDNMEKDKLMRSRSGKNKLVSNLLNTLSAKSDETREHAMRMTEYAHKLGDIINLANGQLNNLSLLATLHDIGKVTISEDILKKPGDLNDEEWEIIKQHPERGYVIASASEEFAPIAADILYHHERWDGNGYPEGIRREEIPILARIISIVDAYDVMTNGRPYKEPMSKGEALEEIEDCAGSQFDPELAAKFVEIME